MEAIKQVVSIVSVTLIIYGVMSMLLPEGSMKNSFKYIISVALLSSLVITVKSADNVNLSFDDILAFNNDGEQVKEIDYSIVEKQYTETYLESFLIEQMQTVAENPFSIEVIMDISEDGYISITKIVVVCSENDKDKITSVLNNLGLDAVFEESGGKEDGY